MTIKRHDPGDRGWLALVIFALGLVAYGLYHGTLWLLAWLQTLGLALVGFFESSALIAGAAILGAFAFAVSSDLIVIGVRYLAVSTASLRSIARSTIPTSTDPQTQKTKLASVLAELMASHVVGRPLSTPGDLESARQILMPRLIKHPKTAAALEELLAALHVAISEGHEGATAFLAKLTASTRAYKPFFATMRLLSLLSFGRLGWGQAELRQYVDPSHLSPAKLRRLVLRDWTAVTTLDQLVGPRNTLHQLQSSPPLAAPSPTATPGSPPLQEPEHAQAEKGTPPEAEDASPDDASTSSVDPAPIEAAIAELQEGVDTPSGWTNPDAHLAALEQGLKLVRAQPGAMSPELEALEARLELARRRLGAFTKLWEDVEQAGENDQLPPAVIEAASKVDATTSTSWIDSLRGHVAHRMLATEQLDLDAFTFPPPLGEPSEDAPGGMAVEASLAEPSPPELAPSPKKDKSSKPARHTRPSHSPNRDPATELGF